jgi:hypothetical protein
MSRPVIGQLFLHILFLFRVRHSKKNGVLELLDPESEKIKVKSILEQTMKAKRGSTSIALLFL